MTLTQEIKHGMEESLEHFKQELRNLRTGRAHPSMLDSVSVEVYGTEMRLKDLASVSTPEARQLLISPFDPSTAGAIGKGIERANLGLMPAVDGGTIRISIPPLTEEIRRDIVKQAKKKAEEAKVSIREHRRKGNDAIKKGKGAGEIAEDEQKRLEKEVQELTDDFCKQIDVLLSEKERDLMSV